MTYHNLTPLGQATDNLILLHHYSNTNSYQEIRKYKFWTDFLTYNPEAAKAMTGSTYDLLYRYTIIISYSDLNHFFNTGGTRIATGYGHGTEYQNREPIGRKMCTVTRMSAQAKPVS